MGLAKASKGRMAQLTRALLVAGTTAAATLLSQGGAFAATCPNEAFRSGPSETLPDCRAYELVSPAPGAGQQAIADELGFEPEAPGRREALVFSSLGAVDEARDNPSANGTVYIAQRGEAGWDAVPVTPPASQLEEEGKLVNPLVDYSEGEALLFRVAPVGAKPVDGRIYLAAPGSVMEIGPLLPRATVESWVPSNGQEPKQLLYLGASRGFSHVLFTNQNDVESNLLWPGDETVSGPSLYEYEPAAGTHEPRLVGLSNGGGLVSQCGTYLGGARAVDAYDAIADEGSRIFFTAEPGGCEGNGPTAGKTGRGPVVGEVLARVNHTETIKISEPSEGDCSACTETEPKSAFFQGASEDGSEVFFLTEQVLLPGAKGQSLYEYDFDGPAGDRVRLLASEVLGVSRVAHSGGRVYFVSTAVLAGGGPEGGQATHATPGEPNLYLLEDGSTTFVATLNESDERDWSLEDARPVETTPDGRFLLFNSRNDLTKGSAGPRSQLYRYEAPSATHPTGTLLRVSIGQEGYGEDGNSSLNTPSMAGRPHAGRPFEKSDFANAGLVSISEDGKFVFFQSPAGLTRGSLNGACAFVNGEGECEAFAENVYEWEAPGGTSCPEASTEGCVFLISQPDTGTNAGESDVKLVGASPSGGNVFFETSDQLAGQDTDSQVDIYDARVEGGFPAPVNPVECVGEGCLGATSAPPVFGGPTSTSVSGSGNVAPIPAPVVKPPSRAEDLTKALKACKAKKSTVKRRSCEAAARKRYGTKRKPKKKKKAAKRGGK